MPTPSLAPRDSDANLVRHQVQGLCRRIVGNLIGRGGCLDLEAADLLRDLRAWCQRNIGAGAFQSRFGQDRRFAEACGMTVPSNPAGENALHDEEQENGDRKCDQRLNKRKAPRMLPRPGR